ncbi:putative vacuolar protein sorting-associated protein 18 [Blattamonas nauphoetae]|uniref:Vacuolar protein sorting-associated protein 18 n=1 Tax=Blattamonas nauphoetae TaxID=2049346 RepID=A0ABQ9Y9J1_9EUKA|nr:putative vacuolar protein sorting-associated protein 18 [Blattamonas nauphoetae]
MIAPPFDYVHPEFTLEDVPLTLKNERPIHYSVSDGNHAWILERSLHSWCEDQPEKEIRVVTFDKLKKNAALTKVFLDPTGQHAIVTTSISTAYVVNLSETQATPIPLDPWKQCQIEVLKFVTPFSQFSSLDSSFIDTLEGLSIHSNQTEWDILIGTKDGKLYRSTFSMTTCGPLVECQEQSRSFNGQAITSIEGFFLSDNSVPRLVLLVSSAYVLVELSQRQFEPSFSSSYVKKFSPLDSIVPADHQNVYSSLSISGAMRNFILPSPWYAWQSVTGVTHPNISSVSGCHNSFLSNTKDQTQLTPFSLNLSKGFFRLSHPKDRLVATPEIQGTTRQAPINRSNTLPNPFPVGMGTTHNHIVLVYPDSVQIWSHLSSTRVLASIPLPRSDSTSSQTAPLFTSAVSDPIRGDFYVLGPNVIYRLVVLSEDDSVWLTILQTTMKEIESSIEKQKSKPPKVGLGDPLSEERERLQLEAIRRIEESQPKPTIPSAKSKSVRFGRAPPLNQFHAIPPGPSPVKAKAPQPSFMASTIQTRKNVLSAISSTVTDPELEAPSPVMIPVNVDDTDTQRLLPLIDRSLKAAMGQRYVSLTRALKLGDENGQRGPGALTPQGKKQPLVVSEDVKERVRVVATILGIMCLRAGGGLKKKGAELLSLSGTAFEETVQLILSDRLDGLEKRQTIGPTSDVPQLKGSTLLQYLLSLLNVLLLDQTATSTAPNLSRQILCTLIVSVYLSTLAQINRDTHPDEYNALFAKFTKFYTDYRAQLHYPTVFTLLGQFGYVEDQCSLAKLTGRISDAIQLMLQHNQQRKALEILRDARRSQSWSGDHSKYEDLVVQFSSDLIVKCGFNLVKLWIDANINPDRLLPAIQKYETYRLIQVGGEHPTRQDDSSSVHVTTERNPILYYLDTAVNQRGHRSRQICDYYIHLLILLREEESLLTFLAVLRNNPTFASTLSLSTALRECQQSEFHPASVILLLILDLFEESFEYALRHLPPETVFDMFLKEKDMIMDSECIKRIWMEIVRTLCSPRNVSNKTVAQKKEIVTRIINTTYTLNGVQLPSILALLPSSLLALSDITAQLSDSIIASSQQRESLQQTLTDSFNHLHLLQDELYTNPDDSTEPNRFTPFIFDPSGCCPICHSVVHPLHSTTPLLSFHCTHVMHLLCALTSIKLSPNQRNPEIRQKAFNSLRTSLSKKSTTELIQMWESESSSLWDSCPLCGDIAIHSISVNLLGDSE